MSGWEEITVGEALRHTRSWFGRLIRGGWWVAFWIAYGVTTATAAAWKGETISVWIYGAFTTLMVATSLLARFLHDMIEDTQRAIDELGR